MALSCIFGCLVLAPITVPVFSAERDGAAGSSLAVFDIESGSRLDKDVAALLTNGIRREVGKAGRFEVLERDRMTAVLRDRSSKIVNCVTRECAVEAGKLLGAGTVIIGTLNKTGKTYHLSLSRVDVKTQTVAFVVEDKSTGNKEDLAQVSKTMAAKLLGDAKVILPRAAGPEDGRFIFHEATVFDNETKLIWLRTADAAGKAMTWDEANDYIQLLNRQNHAEYDNWRLPGNDELATLIGYADSRHVKKNLHTLLARTGFKNVQADYYWSSTSSTDVTGLAWVMDMYGGGMSTAVKTGKGYVWPVRTGPWLFEERSGRH